MTYNVYVEKIKNSNKWTLLARDVSHEMARKIVLRHAMENERYMGKYTYRFEIKGDY